MKKSTFQQFRRAHKRSANSQALFGWLGSDALAASVLATAQRHRQIRQAALAVLPDGLGQACQVVKVEGPVLTMAVPNAAHAAKLRQLAPSLADALMRAGWNIAEIKVRIQADLGDPTPYTPPPKEAVPLDAQALEAFTTLQHRLHGGPLADAVTKLLKRHSA